MTNPDGFTDDETKVLYHIVEAHNIFSNLEKQHPSEKYDFTDAIHKLQYILAMRIIRREHPDIFPLKV